ncbi:MAG TPA: laccase domain-containing protein, partial [Sporosarcina psychrophila]|nr:laccase domain-containing protein [Sporosarcina psychrophila]
VKKQCEMAGIPAERISIDRTCTYIDPAGFSYRQDKKCGRHLSFIMKIDNLPGKDKKSSSALVVALKLDTAPCSKSYTFLPFEIRCPFHYAGGFGTGLLKISNLSSGTRYLSTA